MTEFERYLLILIGVLGGTLVLVVTFSVLSPMVHVKKVLQVFVGYEAPPVLVAFARRSITALAMIAVTWTATSLGIEEGMDLATVAGVTVAVLEVGFWGLYDQLFKGDQNAYNPSKIAGSGDNVPPGGLTAQEVGLTPQDTA